MHRPFSLLLAALTCACLLLCLHPGLAHAVPSLAHAAPGLAHATPNLAIDLRLQAEDDEDLDSRGLTTQDRIVGMDVQQLHRNAKWRYWVGFPALFGGITIWTGGGPGFRTPSPGLIPTIVLGAVGVTVGSIFIDKARQYDTAATAMLQGASAPDPRRERARVQGFAFGMPPRGVIAPPTLSSQSGSAPGLR